MTDFSIALVELRAGRYVRRGCWGSGRFLLIQPPTAPVTVPVILMRTPSGAVSPWPAPHAELFAEDWEVVLPVAARAA